MTMARIPLSEAELTEQASAFVAGIEPARARWEYCLPASHYRYRRPDGRIVLCPNPGSMATSAKILGRRKFWVERGFHDMRLLGFDGAQARDEERHGKHRSLGMQPLFDVGPLKAWEAGHVYFARLVEAPHVLKIGFSRRVHERIDDIERQHRVRLFVEPHGLQVGTHLNEQKWHRSWRSANIMGEWFFDPFMTERTLPGFLQTMAEAA